MKRNLLIALAVVAVCSLGVMSAQTEAIFGVNYIANSGPGIPDATVRINNPGTTNGDLCAMIYVFDNAQEMNECCGCITTPDGLRTLSVRSNLTNNPLTTIVRDGDIKIVSAVVNNSPCDPTANVSPVMGLNSWSTHPQNQIATGGYPITEDAFSASTLSTGELYSLEEDCYFTQRLGSGRGVCSCGSGD